MIPTAKSISRFFCWISSSQITPPADPPGGSVIPAASFAAVIEPSATLAVVMASLASLVVPTDPSIILLAFTEPSASFAVVTASLAILSVLTEASAGFAVATAPSAIFAEVMALAPTAGFGYVPVRSPLADPPGGSVIPAASFAAVIRKPSATLAVVMASLARIWLCQLHRQQSSLR